MFAREGDPGVDDAAGVELGPGLFRGVFEGEVWEEGEGRAGVRDRAVVEVRGGAVDDGYYGVVEVGGVLCAGSMLALVR